MAALTSVTVIGLDAIEPIVLGGGSWSRLLVDSSTAPATATTFGYSVFEVGTATDHMAHTVEELAFVVSGSGHLQLNDRVVPIQADHACHIPAGVWHAVVNDDTTNPLAMVFAFASPTYPPTDRRPFKRGEVAR